jgi:hypothetical protein
MLGWWYWRVCKVSTDSELVRFSEKTESEWRTVKLTRLTQLRHWLHCGNGFDARFAPIKVLI